MDSIEEAERLSAVEVLYCGVCGFPVEYCEFSSTFEKCKPWLRVHCPDAYPAEVLHPKGVEGGEDGEKDGSTEPGEEEKEKEKKEKKEKKGKKGKSNRNIVSITLAKRKKKKKTMSVEGLGKVDPSIQIEDLAKLCRKKFACGCAVGKGVTGEKYLEVQGDFCDNMVELLHGEYGIPMESIDVQDNT
eukprot:TRINITY_DN364_c0_g1_i1.p2 TRINITY_DN364_c0_g1~~TRINITY_DN364_c0_g1_i1.p2  ORF type:complete len:187 (-),score=74.27 TRINITY_DN364_c0_g1_i1:55-615(-)